MQARQARWYGVITLFVIVAISYIDRINIAVLITDSGSDAVSDTFVVNYGSSERTVTPTNFSSAPTIDPSADYTVQSPLGYKTNDFIVMMSNDANGAGK